MATSVNPGVRHTRFRQSDILRNGLKRQIGYQNCRIADCSAENLMDTQTILVLIIVFIATFTASTLGFGFGLISMPLLALFMDIKVVTPLVAVISITLSTFIIAQSRKEVDFKNIWKLVLASVLGIPVGLYVLKGTGDSIMKIILALMIILFSLYSLFGRIELRLKSNWPGYIFGFLSGIVGTAYNMAGPPIIIYGALKGWKPAGLRNFLFSFLFPSSILIVSSHYLGGLVTRTVIHYSLLSIPIVLFNVIVGGRLNKKIPIAQFNRIIYVFLLGVGGFLIFKVIGTG